MRRNIGFGLLSTGDSDASDQDTTTSPKFIELSLFKNSELIELGDTTSYILQNFEQAQLKEKYMGLMHLRFGQNVLQVSYNDEALYKELSNFVNKIVYRFFTIEELHGRAAITQCRSLKNELSSKGYRLFEYNGLVYLYGLSRWKQDIDDIKASIMGESIHDLKFFHYKKSMNLEEKIIYEAIFEHNREFAAIIESDPAQIVSIEPKLSKPQKRNRWGLSFIIRAKKRIEFKNLCRNIYNEIRSFGHATFLTSKPRTINLFTNSKKFTVRYHASRAQLQHFIFVVYEKAKMDTLQIEQAIRELESQGGFKVEGYRYLENELDMGLKSAKFQLQAMGCRTELCPKDSPYAINAYLKWKERSSSGMLRGLIEMANNHARPNSESNKESNSSNEGDEQEEMSYICSNNPSDIENNEFEEEEVEKTEPQPLLFTLSTQKPFNMTVNDRTYSRTPIQSSQLFLQHYNSIIEKQIPIAIVSLPYKILTLNRCDFYNEYVEILPIQEAFESCDNFVEGYVKQNSYANGKRCLSVRPAYQLEYKPLPTPKKKKSKTN